MPAQCVRPCLCCKNSVYNNRSRPCLQYQIGRCLAPCVKGYVTDEAYTQQVNFARLFLQGKDQQVLDHLVKQMEQASQQLNFEEAARIRDQIQAVRAVIEKQFVANDRHDDIDIIAIAYQLGVACVQVLFIRQGKILGNRSYSRKYRTIPIWQSLQKPLLGNFIYRHTKAELFRTPLSWIKNWKKKPIWKPC